MPKLTIKRRAAGAARFESRWRLPVILIFFGLLIGSVYSQENSPGSKEFRLPNGLRVFLVEKRASGLINAVIGFDAGTKDETPETSGLAHILEHYLLLRGDVSRVGPETGLDLQGHGAYINARTGQDYTLFETSLPSEFADFGLQSLKSTVFEVRWDENELEKEKKVILEEISQVEDDPVRLATTLVYENLFQGHPYGKPLYGRPEVITSLKTQQLEEFHRRLYVASNGILAVVGDFNLAEMEERVKAVFEAIPAGDVSPFRPEKAAKPRKPIDLERTLDIREAYLILGFPGPDYNDSGQYAMDVLTEILGRGMTPLLYSALRGRRNLIQTVSMGYSAHRAGGTVIIIFTLEPGSVGAARRELLDYLRTTRNGLFSREDYVGDMETIAFDYLESAKNQIRFKSEEARERGLDLAMSIVSHLILNDMPSRGGYLEAVGKLNSSDLRKIADDYLSRGAAVIVTIRPPTKPK